MVKKLHFRFYQASLYILYLHRLPTSYRNYARLCSLYYGGAVDVRKRLPIAARRAVIARLGFYAKLPMTSLFQEALAFLAIGATLKVIKMNSILVTVGTT